MSNKRLAKLNYDLSVDERELATPLKLKEKDLKRFEVTIAGFTFLDLGYCLACPTCGVVSGVNSRKDLDENVDFFLMFGCEHYKNESK